MKYWLDLHGDCFDLKMCNVPDDCENNIILSGKLSDAGIIGNDDDWTNKMDDYLAGKGINPDEWEVG